MAKAEFARLTAERDAAMAALIAEEEADKESGAGKKQSKSQRKQRAAKTQAEMVFTAD